MGEDRRERPFDDNTFMLDVTHPLYFAHKSGALMDDAPDKIRQGFSLDTNAFRIDS